MHDTTSYPVSGSSAAHKPRTLRDDNVDPRKLVEAPDREASGHLHVLNELLNDRIGQLRRMRYQLGSFVDRALGDRYDGDSLGENVRDPKKEGRAVSKLYDTNEMLGVEIERVAELINRLEEL